MKKIILILLMMLIVKPEIYSQQEENTDSYLSIGPYFSFKGGINGQNVQLGRKNGFSIYPVPDFGATAFMALLDDYSLAASVDLGYSAYSYTLIDARFEDKYNFHYGYLTLSPNFYFLYFNLGFNFGYPLHADFGESIPEEDLSLLAEFKLGASYPILYDEDVAMNIFLNFGYMLTGIYENYAEQDPLKDRIPVVPPDYTTEAFNPRPISISIGLNYLFTVDF